MFVLADLINGDMARSMGGVRTLSCTNGGGGTSSVSFAATDGFFAIAT
jgi:hypothetical protein